jgi:hypothetical protein
MTRLPDRMGWVLLATIAFLVVAGVIGHLS